MTKILNFTPHPITICNNAGEVIRVIQPTGLARLKVATVPAGEIDGVPVTRTQFGEPEGLPEPLFNEVCCACGESCGSDRMEFDGWVSDCCGAQMKTAPAVYYVVSQLVKSALPNRLDLLVPAEVVRNSEGNVIGCKSLGL